MPRPKVDPDKRQRSIIACVPCKTAKIRCDSKTPCSTCVKRSREDKCVYEQTQDAGAARRKRRSATVTTFGSSETSKAPDLLPQNIRPSRASSPDGEFSTNDESQGPKSRMLLSSKFQKGQSVTKTTLMNTFRG